MEKICQMERNGRCFLTYGIWQLLQHVGGEEEILQPLTARDVQVDRLDPVFGHIQVHELF